ncbi:hypothetical protein KR200_011681, partial [Drosophila serrata]
QAPRPTDNSGAAMAMPAPTYVATEATAVATTSESAVELQRKQQQQRLARNSLLSELRRSTIFWFRAKSSDGFQLLSQSCTRILQHGMLLPVELQRLADDFEFLLASAGKRQTQQPPPQLQSQQQSQSHPAVVFGAEEFLVQWTERSLRAQCLTQCLQTLVSDPELMDFYYPSKEAFLRNSSDATALFVCLTAVQMNQSGLLGQLEVRNKLRHRRTCSQPNFSISPKLQAVPEEQRQQKRSFLRRLKSLPNLKPEEVEPEESGFSRRRCQTFSSCSRSHRPRGDFADAPASTSSCSSSGGSPNKRIQLINCDDIKIWTDLTPQEQQVPREMEETPRATAAAASSTSSSVGSFLGSLFGSPPVYTSWFQRGLGEDLNATGEGGVLDNFLAINGRKLKKQQTLFEGVSMLDEAAAAAASAPCTASAPWDIQRSAAASSSSTASTTASSSVSITPGSDKLDQQSLASFLQMSRQTHNNTQLEKENAHFRISEACITAIEHVKWSRRLEARPDHSPSNRNLAEPNLMPYAEQIAGGGENHSAEAVGLQLISRFSDQQLPRLSHLKWLVSEQEAPQKLLPLPMPKKDHEQSSLTRGTSSWAPPRQQIIFTEHPTESRAQLLAKQNQRCAGCGMRVAKHLQQHFRYCSYLGKYMCTGCHRNQISAIPARILRSWDFRCYPVCSFAYKLIEQMYAFPLFHVPDLNGQLYKHKELATARRRRLQLQTVKSFIANCRFAEREQAFFNVIPAHITQDPDMWSMCDFVDVQNSSMNRSIKEVIALSEQHVRNCVLCTGRAFVCEHCKGGELVYPWQRKVYRCDRCGACFHHSCWKIRCRSRSNNSYPCSRCSRLQSRAS